MSMADPSFTVPTAGLLSWLVFRLLPPIVEFGSPVQRATNLDESLWHVPVKVFPRLGRRIGPTDIPRCKAYLDLYEGGRCKDKIRLCWGDQTFDELGDYEQLRGRHVSLLPVAWRTEAGNDRNGYFVDVRLIKNRADRVYAILKTVIWPQRLLYGSGTIQHKVAADVPEIKRAILTLPIP